MNEFFLKLINMSISASWLVLTVLLLRFVLKKAPRWVNVLLWGMVAVRLVFPFSIESALSLIPSAETVPMDIEMAAQPAINSGVPVINSVVNPMLSSFAPPQDVLTSANPLQIWIPVLSILWVVGLAALVLYAAISYWRLCRKIREAVILLDNIYQSENVGSPFVLGVIKPKIYLPYHMEEQDLNHVVAHEQAHIRRKDHWWKPLGFLLLTIHWFNPLMWLAYVLLCRDIELACDEKVIKELGNEQRADYTQALVACSVNRRMIAACPLAFGEVGVKERVKSVMNYKKPAFWIIVLAVVICIAVAVCFLTNPVRKDAPVQDDSYYLVIGTEGVTTVRISGEKTSGGVINADGSAFSKGEKVWLEPLEGIKDLRGLSITAFGADGEILYVLSVPEGFPDAEVINLIGSDSWLLTPGNLVHMGKTYVYEKEGFPDSFAITLYPDRTFTYYEGMLSSYIGVGSWKQDGDTITMTDDGHGGYGLINHFKLDGEDLVFVAQNSSNFTYVQVADGERFHQTEATISHTGGVTGPNTKQRLSLNDVIILSQKGYDLTWSDFEDFSYVETGSGLYIRVYEINEMYELWIGGSDPVSDPMYIYLSLTNDLDTRIDIRDGGVTEFIEKDHSEALLNRAIYDAIINCNRSEKTIGLYHCASFVLLDKEEISGTPVVGSNDHVGVITVYGLALHQGFDIADNGRLREVEGSHTAVAITFDVKNGTYSLKEYWRPGDGAYYVPDLREKFPDAVEEDALDTQKYIMSQKQNCYDQAVRYCGIDTAAVVSGLLEDVASSPAYSTVSGAYVDAQPIEYRELMYYGQHTLQYGFEQFLRGEQTGLLMDILASVCRDIMLSWGEGYAIDGKQLTGYDWFEAFRSNAESLAGQYSNEELAEQYPGAYILQQMGGIASVAEYISGIPVLDDPNATVSKLSGKNIIVAYTVDSTTAYADSTLNHTEFIIPKGKAVIVLQTLGEHAAEITYAGRTVWVDSRCLILA